MTKTLGRGPTRSQKSLNVFAAVALVASLITVYLPLPAQAANNAEFIFFFDNGAILDAENDVGGDYTIPDQFFINYYGGVENIPDGFDYQGRDLHVSCSETFPNGYAGSNNDFPIPPPSADADNGWGIQSYTIVRHLPSGDTFCGETFEPAKITVVKNTTPETGDAFKFRLVGQMFPDPPQKKELADFGPDDRSVDGDGDSYTWEVNSGNFTLSELTGQNPSGYEFDSVNCSVAGGGPNPGFVEDGASVNFDIIGGQHVTCTFHNEGPPPEPGKIIVTKEVTEGSDEQQAFQFTASYDADGFALAHGQSDDSGDLPPGTYSVSETVLEGWSLESATCDSTDVNDQSTPGNIDLDAGETVTCTFVNHKIDPGTVTVIKKVVGDQSAEFTFTGDVAGTIGHNESLSEVAQLNTTYSSTEVVPTGWDLVDLSCVADGGTFQIDGDSVDMTVTEENGSVTCTFTNREDGEIIVDKNVTEGSDATQLFDFQASYDGDEDDNGQFSLSGESSPNNSGDLDPGTYSVSETVPEGWRLVSASCSDGSTPSNIDLEPGETVTCTFVNHEIQPGTIVIEKVVTEGSSTETLFTFDETGFSLDENPLADGDSGSATVEPGGQYSVEENLPEGWILQSATCDDNDSTPEDINVSEGETVTCTFVNHEIQPGTVTVIKNVIGDQSAEFTFNGDLAGTIGHNQSISVEADLDTVYGSTEVVPDGWELADISCVADGGTFEIGDESVDMTVTDEDGSVTCTFTNGELPTITVVKQTLLADPEDDTTFAFSGDLSGNLGDGDSMSATVQPGTYVTTEGEVGNWDLISIACDDGASGNVESRTATYEVGYGDDITCTFTNVENEVRASVLVTVSGACIPDGDEGIGRITVNMSVDGAANVVVRDSDGDVVGSRSTSGTITVPEGATYTWEATANADEGFEFPVDFDPTGEVTIDTCSEGEELPFTGLNSDITLAMAALLLVSGMIMVRSANRREET